MPSLTVIGIDGYKRRVSLTMAWRYLRFGRSDSCTHLSLPTLMSSSCWADFRALGWLSSKESAHVTAIDVPSVPPMMRICKLRKTEQNRETMFLEINT